MARVVWIEFIAFFALAIALYTYIGYPIVIGLLARLFPVRRIQTNHKTRLLPSVTVCIPLYNAANYIETKLDTLLCQDYPANKIDILIFCDGCSDKSNEIVTAYAQNHPSLHVVESAARVGKPIALNRLVSMAQGEVLLLTDSRQPLHPSALQAMVQELLSDPTVGCVSGNLMLQGSAGAGVYWRYEKWIRQQEACFRSMIGVSGAIYVVRKTDFAPMPPDLILDDMWTPLHLRLKGKSIVWCDDAIAYDQAFEDDREFVRKVRTLFGNFQLFAYLPELLSPFQNPSWFETISHKLLRLLCPWALLALLVASSLIALGPLPNANLGVLWLMRSLVLGQALFYILALCGSKAGRMGSLSRTFVVLNAAAVVGLWRFIHRSQKVTW